MKKLVHFVKFESMSSLYSCPLLYCFIFVHEIMLVNKEKNLAGFLKTLLPKKTSSVGRLFGFFFISQIAAIFRDLFSKLLIEIINK